MHYVIICSHLKAHLYTLYVSESSLTCTRFSSRKSTPTISGDNAPFCGEKVHYEMMNHRKPTDVSIRTLHHFVYKWALNMNAVLSSEACCMLDDKIYYHSINQFMTYCVAMHALTLSGIGICRVMHK